MRLLRQDAISNTFGVWHKNHCNRKPFARDRHHASWNK